VSFRNHRVGSALGALSVALAAVPIVYIFHSDSFPHHSLTETVVLFGGVGGSVLAALGAGLVGSRWWFLATLAAAVDVVCLWGFNP
jgi:cytochrome c biogenesis protein ResB